MDRIIEIRINGSHLWKDNRLAGVQGEGNVNFLRITFDESWDGFAKKVTFWDAKGNNPVERTLTADLLEDITVSTLTYLCPIPPEPMAEAGMMTFVIDGWVYGKRARSVGTEMEVEYAPMADNAGEPIDPTPTQAEQIQKQIDTILGDMQERAVRAENAADAAEVSEANAKQSEENAKQSETVAQNAAADADGARDETVAASAAAVAAAESAKAVEDRVMPAAERAVQAAASAKASENVAVASAESAGASAEAAATHEVGARAASAGVDTAKNEAVASAVAAAKSEAAAKAAQAAAEKARDEATATVGGDFASTAYVDNKAEEAEDNANRYTDQKFSSIPTPDVSGQIGAHNTSTTAHADIRQALDGKVPLDGSVPMSGATLYLKGKAAAISTDGKRAVLNSYETAGSSAAYRSLIVRNKTEDADVASAIGLAVKDSGDSIERTYKIYGEHNKPTTDDIGAIPIDGSKAMTGSLKTPRIEQTDYGQPLELGQYIDLHRVGSASDYDARIEVSGNNDLLVNGKTVLHAGNATNYAAPPYTYGTEDMEAGVTPLASGTLYFVYE